jgi:hypothetical protein
MCIKGSSKGGENSINQHITLSSFLKEEYPEGGRWLVIK